MLSKAQKDFLAGMLGITSEELDTGIASETEAQFEIPAGKLYSETDIQTLTDNSSREGYDRGALASREMVLKDMSREVGLENIAKDGKSFIESYKAEILKDVSTEPSEKITELETTVSELRNKLTEKEGEFTTYQSKVAQDQRNNTLKGLIPNLADKIGLSQDEALNLFLSNYEISNDGVKKDGETLFDDLRNPITPEKALESWIGEKGWNTLEDKSKGGRLDQKNRKDQYSTPKSIDDFQSALSERGLTEGSMEANALFQEMAKANPEILED